MMRSTAARAAACLLIGVLAAFPQGGLKLVIVEGDGAVNNIQQRVAREPIVQVTDEDDRPVAGAVVAFTLPDHGASGVFADGSRLFTTTTDANGRAVARGFQANNVTGEFEMNVTASYAGKSVSRRIKMTNLARAVPVASGGGGKIFLILALVGGAVAGGVAAAAGGSGGSSPAASPAPPPAAGIVISPGAGSVGPPR
jgi:hypothetical protein